MLTLGIGLNYVENLVRIFQVFERVSISLSKSDGNAELDKHDQLIRNSWGSLTGVLGPALSSALEGTACNEQGFVRCSLCLCAIATDREGVLLAHQGSHYHATCANFWVNLVNLNLPKLLS